MTETHIVTPELPRPPASQSATWSQSLLFNVVIPLTMLAGAGLTAVLLGTVAPAERPPTDTTRVGRLKALPPVRVERLQSLEETGTPLRLQVDGTVVPYRESRVAAEVAGRVVFKSDDCEAGAYVRKDQLLMRIDPTDFELDVQRLTRMKEQDYQALRELDQQMTNTQRLIDVAGEDVKLQQKEVDRQNAMPTGFASRAEIDQAKRGLLASTQQLVSVENQLELLRQQRLRLEAAERLADTQLKIAELNLARTEIRAPIEGVIVSEEADLNTFVTRGTTLVVIEDTSKVDVASSLRMDQLYWVLNQKGISIDTSARGYNLPETAAIIEYELAGRENLIYRWKGKLLSYDGIGLDPSTRTVPVRVVVDDPRHMVDETGQPVVTSGAPALVRGMYVRVKLLIQPTTSLVVIPARALQPGNRVFQFMPDESVLETAFDAVATTVTVDGKVSDAKSVTEQQPSDDDLRFETPDAAGLGDGFDASQWAAGKVYVRRSVTPVDSLSVGDHVRSDTGDSISAFEGANRRWVCEVHDERLRGGSYVVVSPLGGIEDKAISVRANRSAISGEFHNSQPTDSTAVVTAPVAEGA